MPKEQVAIAKRMQNMHVTLLNATTFEAVVDNEIVAKEFYLDDSPITRVPTYPPEKPQGNHECTYQHSPLRKSARTAVLKKFQMMVQKNNALLQLKDEFGLELY